MELSLSKKEKQLFIKLARNEIEKHLGINQTRISEEDLKDYPIFFTKDYGSFVTLHIGENLRGCIGYIQPITILHNQIRMCAKAAAFEDPRFYPLTREEYPDISVEISLLSPIERVNSLDEIKVGRDGLIVQHSIFQGLLLPQVATENNWTKEEFLSHTCLKAGLPSDCWKRNDVIIKKFSAYVFDEKELKGD